MRILYKDYIEIAKKVKSKNLNIVVYGAGMVGKILLPYIIQEYELEKNVLFYVDGDNRKQGQKIHVGSSDYDIKNPEELRKLSANTILLITNSNFLPIIDMLDTILELKYTEAYIIPMIQVENTHVKKEKYEVKVSDTQLIPKKIHYCWFSRNTMPDYLKKCIESWYKYCPDYEIIRWDEDNYDINKNTYMSQAYEARKWGFVPDIARLDILYQHGGIYLDTDVELIRNIDDLLYQSAFVGVEKWGNINMGGGSGAVAKHPIIKKMLDFRKDEMFLLEDGSLNLTTCGYYETKPLIDLGMKPNNAIQKIEDMTIYSSDFFHPYDYMSGELTITENTYSIHQFNGGWLEEKSMAERKKTMMHYHQIVERMKAGNNE